eukprot:g1457.t1
MLVKIVHPVIPSSIGLLTRNLLDLWALSKDSRLDLDYAANKLKVPKRRIFGITNIFEGIGLIGKTARNEVEWLGDPLMTPEWDRSSLEAMEKELRKFQCEERLMNAKIAFMRESIVRANQMPNFRNDSYLLPQDLRNIPSLADSHIFSVTGSQNVSFKVSEETESSQNKILINGHDEDLDVCVLNTSTSVESKKRKHGETRGDLSTNQRRNRAKTKLNEKDKKSSMGDIDLGDIHALCQEEAHSTIQK